MTLSADEIKEAVDTARDFLRQGGASVPDARDFALELEQILRNTEVVYGEEAAVDVLTAARKSLVFLLDRVDARDSLAFREATNPEDAQVGS